MTALNLFLLGATGYIGGALLVAIRSAHPDFKISALVRSQGDVGAVKAAGADDVIVSSHTDLEQIRAAASAADIVLNAADSDDLPLTKAIIAGLKIRSQGASGKLPPVPILIHTSGTGVISDNAKGSFTDEAKKIWNDNDENDIRSIKKTQPHRLIDLEIFQADERGDMSGYIIAPSTVYGVGGGPVRKISSQVPNMIRAAVRRKQTVYVGEGTNRWMNVHINDLSNLYLLILDLALSGDDRNKAFGKFYFGSIGEHVWGDVAKALAPILHDRGVVDNAQAVSIPWDDTLRYTATNSRSVSNRGFALGWKPAAPSLEATLEEDVAATLKQ